MNPSSFDFGNVAVGTTSKLSLAFTNSGSANLIISQASVSGSAFALTGLSTPLTVAPGQSSSCTISFSPPAAGKSSGTISFATNATASTTSVSLSGSGIQGQLSVNSTNASFGNVFVGSSSSQTVILTNSGTAAMTISQVSVTGAGFSTGGFNVPLALNVGQTTALTITFSPTTTGTVNGSVSVVSNASNSPATVTVSGTGAQPQLIVTTPTPINFGNVNVGSTSSSTVTLQNSGNTSVTITQGGVSGSGFAITGLATPLAIASGQSTSFSVQFGPPATGSATGIVSIVSNAINSPLTIPLSGAGIQTAAHSVDLSWAASPTPAVNYNVYRGSVSGGPYTKLTSTVVSGTMYTDTTVASGQTYFYVLTAADSSNNESVYSNQVSAAIP